MSALHTIGFKVGRLVERVITLAFSGLAGGIVGSILAGGGDGFVPGAIFGVFVGAAIAAIRAGRRAAAARAQTGRIGTLMAISSEAPPGAPWYHHTYVLIDEQGRRHKFRLTPEQARTFSGQFAVGDVGRFTAAGNTLASFVPASPEAPVRPKTGIRVFISYAHELDREGQMAEYAAEVFAAAGLEPWVDRTAVKPGQKLREELVKQIAGADFFVPLL